MQQHRNYAEHHDTSPDERLEPSTGSPDRLPDPAHFEPGVPSRFTRSDGLPDFAQAGPQVGDLGSVRFVAARKLRRLDIDGPSPLVLSINGRIISIVLPGENAFDPPLPLEPGDTLQFAVADSRQAEDTSRLSGWSQASTVEVERGARGGRHV